VTDGTQVGVSQHVGEAVRNHTLAYGNNKPITVIGIAPWGFINNRQQLVNSQVCISLLFLLFVSMPIKHKTAIKLLLNTETHAHIHEWSYKWQMSFNVSKCCILRIHHHALNCTLRNTLLNVVNSNSYLGVTDCSDFSWHEHVSNVSAKTTKTLNFIRRNVYCCLLIPRLQLTFLWFVHI